MEPLNDKRSIVQRIARGVAANGFGQAVSFLYNFVNVPLFYHFWGASLYGEWLSLSAVPVYLSMSDLSFGTTSGSEMTMLVAQDKRAEALTVLQSTWLLVTGVSLFLLVVTLGLAWTLPVSRLLGLSTFSDREARGVLTVLLMAVVLSQQGGVIEAVARAAGLYASMVFWLNVMHLVEFLLMVLVLTMGGDPWVFAWALLAPKLVGYSLFWAWYGRKVPWLYLGWSKANLRSLKPLVTPALTFNSFNLGFALSLQGIIILIAKLLTPVDAAVFGPLRTLTRVLFQGASAIGNTIWMELSRAMGAGDLDVARRIHRRASQTTFWVALPASVVLCLFGPAFFKLWTGTPAPVPVFVTLVLVALIASMWAVSYVVPLSVNKHQSTAFVFLGAAAVSVGLAMLLLPRLGLLGGAAAMAVGDGLMLAFCWRRAMQLLGDDFAQFTKTVFTPPVGMLRTIGRARP